MKSIPIAALLVFAFWLAACSLSPPIQEETNPEASASTTSNPGQPTGDVSQPEDSTAFQTNPTPVYQEPAIHNDSEAGEALRFVFPTPARLPVSNWRPPLYPTPWAPTAYDHFYFTRPISANEINWPLPDYRYGGIFLPEVVHTGIDIPAPAGTPVLAAGAGRVTWAGFGLYSGEIDPDDPYGLAIAIKHDFGHGGEALFTVYGHLQQSDVVVGQHVEPGEQIGLVGQTGRVTGPHLHFEVRVGRNHFFGSRNPELWLAPPQGWGVLAGRVMTTFGELLADQLVTVRSLTSGQSWKVKTYGLGAVVSDAYYNENLVLGDLPAGEYEIWLPYEGSTYDQQILIQPGMISYFTFRGRKGYKTEFPPTPEPAFTPPIPDSTSNP